MKKLLTLMLSLVFVFCLCLGSFASTPDISVSVGQTFAWNDSSADPQQWIQSKGVSPDGLWQYQFYALETGVYGDLSSVYSNGFAFSTNPGMYGIGYARVRNNGINFHPGETADTAKVFTCPAGGRIRVTSTLTRINETGYGVNGTSFAAYLEGTTVFPSDGAPYVEVNDIESHTFTFEVQVAKGQRLYLQIGAIDGNSMNDSTNMTNEITYLTVDDSVAPPSQPSTTPDYGEMPDITIKDESSSFVDSDDADASSDARQEPSEEKKQDEEASDVKPSETREEDEDDDGDEDIAQKGLSAGMIAVIAFGTVGGLIIIAVAVLVIVSLKKP